SPTRRLGKASQPTARRTIVSRKTTAMKKTATSVKKSGANEAKGGVSPSRHIDARIEELGDWRGEMLARIRGVIKKADPEVVEEWKFINTLNGGLNQLGIGTQCLLGMAPVLGGNIMYSSIGPPYPPGTSANLQCANGQLPSGTTTPPIGGTFPGSSSGSSSSSTATCINGQWQPAQFVGQCFGATTGGGFGAQTTFPPAGLGTTPFSPFTSQQQQQQLQQQQQPQCLLGIATLALNGRIQYSNGALLGPYQAGTTATLTCNPGFVPNGQSTASCQNGQFQPAALGQCVQSSADQTWPPSSSSTTSSTRSTAITQGTTTMNGTSTTSAAFGNETTAAATCFELPQPLNGRFVYSPMGLMPPYPIADGRRYGRAVGGMPTRRLGNVVDEHVYAEQYNKR
uniref:Sushi domain-containing protein n=1 Tax=Globodera pallida TaxID=36090 RepID=A0A183CR36_GLOPA